jgi:hypothetical protein
MNPVFAMSHLRFLTLHGMTYYRKKPTLIRARTVIWPLLEGDLKSRQECDMSDFEITLHGMTYYQKNPLYYSDGGLEEPRTYSRHMGDRSICPLSSYDIQD